MQIIEKSLKDLVFYENNPRNNQQAVKYVKNSILKFGFRNPLLIDKNNIIIAGHTRAQACIELGINKVPCIIVEDLTEEQIKAFRLADNKVSEIAEWNYDMLLSELKTIENIDMKDFSFLDIELPNIDDVDDISEENYIKPKKDLLECPKCHHLDSKNHFIKREEK